MFASRSLIAGSGVALVLQATRAFASGREGEGLVAAIFWIVALVLLVFAATVFGGGLLGAFRSSESGESRLKSGGRGLLKGLLAFVVVMTVLIALATVLGFLWIVFSLVYAHVLSHPT